MVRLADDLEDVLVLEHVGEADALGAVLRRRAPDIGVVEDDEQLLGDARRRGLDRDAVALRREHDRLVEVRGAAAALAEDAHEAHGVPHARQQVVEVQLEVHGHDDRVRLPRELLDVLERDHVDLVVDVEAPHVLAVPVDDVDELVRAVVAAEQDLAVVEPELVQDRVHRLRGVVAELRQRHRRVELDAARRLLHERDVRRRLVQPQPHGLELPLQDALVVVDALLARVQDDQNEVRRPRDRDDLLAPALAVGRALDDARQIQQLDLRVVVEDVAGDARQRREFVARGLALRARQRGQQARLADGGEADEGHAAVARLLDVEAVAAAAGRRLLLQQGAAQLAELRLDDAEVALRRLVLLRPRVLRLQLLDLVDDAHGRGGVCARGGGRSPRTWCGRAKTQALVLKPDCS